MKPEFLVAHVHDWHILTCLYIPPSSQPPHGAVDLPSLDFGLGYVTCFDQWEMDRDVPVPSFSLSSLWVAPYFLGPLSRLWGPRAGQSQSRGTECESHIHPLEQASPPELVPDMEKMKVAQSCPTLCNPMDCSLPGSSVHGILQARILEWVAIPFSRGSSQPRNWTRVSGIAGGFFTSWATREGLPELVDQETHVLSWAYGLEWDIHIHTFTDGKLQGPFSAIGVIPECIWSSVWHWPVSSLMSPPGSKKCWTTDTDVSDDNKASSPRNERGLETHSRRGWIL